MSNLFIIGNGFDLAHNLPTGYNDFYKYLIETYPEVKNMEPTFNIESRQLPDGGEEFDRNEVVAFLIDVISEAEKDGHNWSDIENTLGKLNFDRYFDDMDYIYVDEDDDRELYRRPQRYEEVSRNFYKVVIQIRDLFAEWINSIDTFDTNPKKIFVNLINPEEDTFFTFNYTPILQELYDAQLVKHVHGSQGNDIIIGHGKKPKINSNGYIGTENALERIHSELRKETAFIIENELYEFYDSLESVKNIYSYGFSFSQVDLPYIETICLYLDTKDMTWYLNSYNYDKDGLEFKKRIRQCGFKGRFDTFS
ncbi:bacteriophage abortive infection AbiH family protein [Priestia megaterium]|uniref:bacteriophage abortive infection AbiH family protein n=1 Tax=Priestia megaterium TaxID=1404 RepID=UPI003EDF887A